MQNHSNAQQLIFFTKVWIFRNERNVFSNNLLSRYLSNAVIMTATNHAIGKSLYIGVAH